MKSYQQKVYSHSNKLHKPFLCLVLTLYLPRICNPCLHHIFFSSCLPTLTSRFFLVQKTKKKFIENLRHKANQINSCRDQLVILLVLLYLESIKKEALIVLYYQYQYQYWYWHQQHFFQQYYQRLVVLNYNKYK